MQKLFFEVNSLDKRCYEEFGLTEDILLEQAATSISNYIQNNFNKNSKILIACGAGNNGADGITLARILFKTYDVSLFLPNKVQSQMGKIQLQRVKKVGLKEIDKIEKTDSFDIVVDCLFGTGLTRDLNEDMIELIKQLNKIESFKLSCDIPSGINIYGQIETVAFKADLTITMGALKTSLFSDEAKDYTGEIKVADLGVQREIYETNSNIFLLEYDELQLPFRKKLDTNKGTFGHLGVIAGSKIGASILCAKAGFTFGAGLVSVIGHKNLNLPYHIMQNHKIPQNTTAIAIGMGLGNYEKEEILKILQNDTPKVVDADLFYQKDILEVLTKENVVLTPHPKEFCSLLKLSKVADIKVKKLQKNRFEYLKKFCKNYPNVVVILKGANTLIGQNDKLYINSYGSSKLSFGGSGDVLAGFVASLLAQGYNPLKAAISGTLAHTKSAELFSKNNYSMTPLDLIELVKEI